MGKFIGIQSGHKDIASNCDPVLATETGATGEVDFNWKVTLSLSNILQGYGFAVQIDDANANCPGNPGNTIGKDFDLYIAIHAESEPPGGYVGIPDPSVDAAHGESLRIQKAINDVYFSDTGIVENDKILTDNISYYYMWNVLTAKTPCILIECGALADPHDSVILADIRRVALGIAHGICVAFGVTWKGDIIENSTTPPVVPAPKPSPISLPPQPDSVVVTKESLWKRFLKWFL